MSEPTGVGLRAAGSLVERALAALRERPLHTTELAARVLAIAGSPPAAAGAVFALLGTDPRFEVDAAGVWSLALPPECAAASLLEEEWVVVDVETTGGAPERGHRVTELAAVRVSRGRIVESYATLVNPERPIPRMITALTGISDRMVSHAPRFRDVATEIAAVLGGRVFVAHNAAFDWRFVSHEMERALGRTLEGRRLCTVRLARRLLPQLPSRSLDGLAEFFGLEIASRHRAPDDALATARVLLRFVEMLQEREVSDWPGVQALLERRSPRRKPRRSPRSMDSA